MHDPTPALFITRERAADLAAILTARPDKLRAVAVGPVRDGSDMGFQVRIYGPGIPAAGRPFTNGEAARLH